MKKNHLTEKKLIEYQFKLASEEQMAEATEHLKECEECRELNERLAAKFSSLELLREEPQLSEKLVSQVLKNIKAARRAKLRTYKMPAWIGAAAVVLLVASLLVVSEIKEYKKSRLPEGAGINKPQRTEGYDYADKKIAAELEDKAKRDSRGLARGLKAGKSEVLMKEEDKPPFAPASAIELVTLPRRENVQITIYNSADLTLVRERRNLTLKRGWNWLQFMWANTLIDPTSLNLEPLEEKEKIDIEQLVFPARLKELGRWLIKSQVEGQVPFEITYFTSGLAWRAFYMGTLSEDEESMQLKGYVRVGNNSGEDYEDAQTRLIVGKVHILDEIAELARRQYPYGRPGIERWDYIGFARDKKEKVTLLGEEPLVAGLFRDVDEQLRRKDIKKEGLSEYFLYTIEGTETIPDKWGKRLLSFEAEDIKVKSLYKYDEERWGPQAIRFVAFANDEEHNLGETPIPNGAVKIYSQDDEQGYLLYVGGTSIKYIPVDEEIELNLGVARLVSVEPTLMDYKTDNYIFDKDDDIVGWDEIRTWQIKVTNTRELAVEIEITRGFDTPYWTLGTDTPYDKYDVTHARFKLEVEPRSKKNFEYTVTTYHGVREESLTK